MSEGFLNICISSVFLKEASITWLSHFEISDGLGIFHHLFSILSICLSVSLSTYLFIFLKLGLHAY